MVHENRRSAKMIKAIVFDNTGVVTAQDHEKTIVDFIKRTQIKHEGDLFDKITKLDESGETSPYQAFKIITKDSNISAGQALKIYGECYEKHSLIDKRMVELIRKLKRGYKIYCLTNTNTLHYSINKRLGAFEEFHKVFTSFKIGLKKPDEKVYLHLAKKVRLRPKEVIFVDDNLANVQGARKAGMKGIIFTSYDQLVQDLKSDGVKW